MTKQLYDEVKPLVPLIDAVVAAKSTNGACVNDVRKSLGEEAPSNLPDDWGERPQPFDYLAAQRFRVYNSHQEACIVTKVMASGGLGMEDDPDEPPMLNADGEEAGATQIGDASGLGPALVKAVMAAVGAAMQGMPSGPGGQPGMPMTRQQKRRKRSRLTKLLDKLCKHSWAHTLMQVLQDFWELGNGYLEVVREDGRPRGKIAGLHWISARDVWIVTEGSGNIDWHFIVRGRIGGDVRMARFGDLVDFRRRTGIQEGKTSEIIHFAMPTSLNRWYGFPDWLSAGPLIELVQALHQHQFDFHHNKGVPELLLLFLGSKLDTKTWNTVTSKLDGHVGLGNQFKMSAFNIADPNVKVQVEKLAMEGIQNGTFFRDMSETLATAIVTSHRVPPAIANIFFPGRMGAANELPNSVVSFQSLVVGPIQNLIETVLETTLGGDKGIKGLTDDMSWSLKTVLDEMSEALQKLTPAKAGMNGAPPIGEGGPADTMSRMRQQLPEAAAEGRDVNGGGLKD